MTSLLSKVKTCDVTIRQLDWSKFNAGDFKKVDVIVGSDIVYERTILPALCDVIRILLVGFFRRGTKHSIEEGFLHLTKQTQV